VDPDNAIPRTSAGGSIRCPNCGNLQSDDNRFCPQCGNPLVPEAASSGSPNDLGPREVDQVLESVDRERPYTMLRVVGILLVALGWITLAASAIAVLAAIVTLILAKPLPVAGIALVKALFAGIALALLMLAGGDLVDWVIDAERHARETNLMLESLLRESLRQGVRPRVS